MTLFGCSDNTSEFSNFSEVKEELKNYKFGTYKNLKFICDVPSVDAEKIYEFKIERNTEWTNLETEKEKLRKMVEVFFNIKIKNTEILSSELSPHTINYQRYSIQNSEKKVSGYASLASSHTFILADYDELFKTRFQKDARACLPYINLNETSVKVTLNGKQIDLQAFVKKAENEIKQCCSDIINEGEEIKAFDAVKIKSSIDGNEYITLRFSHVIDGIAYNQDGFGGVEEGITPLPSYITVEMNDQGSIASIYNPYYYTITQKTEVKNILSLSKASDLLSKELAPNLTYEIKNVDIRYVNITNTQQTASVAKPMWCYTLEEYNGGYGEPYNFFLKKVAFVDALNGDIYIADALNNSCEVYKKE